MNDRQGEADTASSVDDDDALSRRHTRRVTLDLSDDDHLALKLAAAHQRSSMAELLRALVALWRSDPDLAERVRTYLAVRGPR